MVELKNEGNIKHLGPSSPPPTTLHRAVTIHPITALEMESPLLFCLARGTNFILSTCRELGISITAYSPIGRGILTGTFRSHFDIPENDLRRFLPKYSEANFLKVVELVELPAAVMAALCPDTPPL